MSGSTLLRWLFQVVCLILFGVLAGLLLASCGGGGGGGGSTPQATTTYAFGRIAGFGSIVVNGVHFDESAARILDEDGVAHASGDLRLGMVVELDADDHDRAHHITFFGLMRGPVESVATDSLVVLGQTVAVNATTVFDPSLAGGIAAIKPDMVLRIFGMISPSGSYTASRIEPSHADSYALLGFISAIDTTAKTLNIGNALIDVSALSLPNSLAVGDLVRVKLQTTQVNGAWVATALKSGNRRPHEGDHAEVEGIITDFTSTSAFSVNGLPVDASGASFPNGTTGVVKGAHVEVEGAVVNGVLVATKVEVEDENEMKDAGFEVRGLIDSVDSTHSTFVVHGVTVSYGGDVMFKNGTAADLKIGAKVEVKGTLAADGTTLNATRIQFGSEDS
jgi:hypothetical protein